VGEGNIEQYAGDGVRRLVAGGRKHRVGDCLHSFFHLFASHPFSPDRHPDPSFM
jgi:hypothetical protein